MTLKDEMKIDIEQHPLDRNPAVLARAMEEIDRLRNAMQEAADQIRRCDYTPARSTLLVALDHGA